ncbi:phosphoethanolamine transferase [Shewanella sp. UCD-KL21]|uniref:phosphoethanolamine transferase n=1 Tax=Shewanella sp. UCD-KL21 TaxID=1917164 RepID=UPI0020C9C1CF|nr:phosphoethanolamine--lipid A transferase [Shewanella sp. UCD-KL21]
MTTFSRLYSVITPKELSKETMIVLMALYFTLVINFPLIQRIFQLSTDSHFVFSITPALVLFSIFIIVFCLFSSRFIFKPLLTILLLTSAAAMYGTMKYQVYFDYAMIENIFETNTGEALSYISTTSILYILVFGLIPSIWLWRVRLTPSQSLVKSLMRRSTLVIVGLGLIGVVLLGFYKDYVSMGRNNVYLKKMVIPAHAFNTVKYIYKNNFVTPLPYTVRGQDARLIDTNPTKPTLFVLVVGETARAQNMAYYGYSRNTNPYTENLDFIVVNNVSSCGTATAHSLPCMFSDLTHDNYNREKALATDNLLDIIHQAGVEVVWLDNDGGDKHLADHVIEFNIPTDSSDDLCDGNSCYDQVLVREFASHIEQRLETKQQTLTNQLLILHTIGSHGPTYFKRYPKDKQHFSPACERSDLENCSDEEIINVYDNTLVYTDYILSEIVKLLEQYASDYEVAMMYISDHGESLGESGMYLHGTPYAFAPAEQTLVPWYLWLPESYAQSKQLDRQCIITQVSQGTHSHDNLFNTLIGLYGVDTHLLDTSLDLSHSCMQTTELLGTK